MDHSSQCYCDSCKEHYDLEETEIRSDRHSSSTAATLKMFLSSVNVVQAFNFIFQKAKVWMITRTDLQTNSKSIRIALSKRSFSGIGNLHPLRIRRCLGVIVVVPVPPFVRRRLRITLRRVFPLFLPAKRSDIEIVPGVPHLLVAAIVDEVGPKNLL